MQSEDLNNIKIYSSSVRKRIDDRFLALRYKKKELFRKSIRYINKILSFKQGKTHRMTRFYDEKEKKTNE